MISRRILFAFVYLLALVGGFWLSTALHDVVLGAEAGAVAAGALAVAFVTYVVFTAVPFVPGAEIGFGLLMVLGADGALAVYAGMILALTLAFVAGRYVPPDWLRGFFSMLGLDRASALVARSMELSMEDRARFIETHAPTRWVPFLLRHRYVALGVLLNTPGNVVLGGGGGLAFAAGASRLFSTAGFLATILVAAAPVPLAVLLFGSGDWLLRA